MSFRPCLVPQVSRQKKNSYRINSSFCTAAALPGNETYSPSPAASTVALLPKDHIHPNRLGNPICHLPFVSLSNSLNFSCCGSEYLTLRDWRPRQPCVTTMTFSWCQARARPGRGRASHYTRIPRASTTISPSCETPSPAWCTRTRENMVDNPKKVIEQKKKEKCQLNTEWLVWRAAN